MRMSIDQIARQMFAIAKHFGSDYGSPFNVQAIRARLIAVPLSRELETKVQDAFFRLVDRNLVRWSEGSQATAAHYVLTERGRSSQFADGTIDDPDPVIGDVESRIARPLDPVAKQYLRESVAAFHDGRLLSAQFCLGAVAERIAFLVRDWVVDLTPAGEKLKKVEFVGQVVSGLPIALLELSKGRTDWAEQIDEFTECLEACAGVYRRTRNDVGHPTAVRQIDEDEVATMMSAMRRLYIPAAYGLLVLSP